MFVPLDELEAVMLEANKSSYEEAVKKYIDANPKRVQYWMTGEFK